MAEEKPKKEGKEGEAKQRRPTALKRDMQSERRRLANRAFKAEVSTAIRSLKESAQKGEKTQAKQKLTAVYSPLDKGTKTGIFKANKAARDKSRLAHLA